MKYEGKIKCGLMNHCKDKQKMGRSKANWKRKGETETQSQWQKQKKNIFYVERLRLGCVMI